MKKKPKCQAVSKGNTYRGPGGPCSCTHDVQKMRIELIVTELCANHRALLARGGYVVLQGHGVGQPVRAS